MADGSSGIITLNSITELVTQINTDLLLAPIQSESVINDFVWRRSGGNVGETVKFPMRLWANRRKKRNLYEEIPGTKPLITYVQVTHDEWAPDMETIPRWTNLTDLYGILKDDVLPAMLARIEDEYAADVAELIYRGASETTPFDGKVFWLSSKTHLAAPGRPESPKYKNWLKVNRLDASGMKKAIELLETQPGPDGNYKRMPGQIYCLCSTYDQYDRAMLLYNGEFLPTPVGANAAATQPNIATLKGKAVPIYFPHLQAYFTGASGETGDAWVLVKKFAKWAPFILSFANQGEPQIFMEGLSLNDHSMVMRKLKHIGYVGGWGTGFGDPSLGVLNTETT